MSRTSFEAATLGDVPALARLEAASYPLDEAASEATMAMRCRVAGAYFRVAKQENGSIVGFINGTCVSEAEIHHESMTSHVPGGQSLVIHSVCVDESHRKAGVGTRMLKQYISMLRDSEPQLKRVLLLSKAKLLEFYINCGFSVMRLSPVVHGSESWFELELDLVTLRHTEQYVVDAFTSEQFGGNPAAVVFEHRSDEWMQRLAMENNLSETAFVRPHINADGTAAGPSEFDLRWFTPRKEVALCGHATLGASHALLESGRAPRTAPIKYHTLSGVLTATPKGEDCIELSFPISKVEAVTPSAQEYEYILQGFELRASDLLFVGVSEFDLFIEISPERFESLSAVNGSAIGALESLAGRGVIICCEGPRFANPTDSDASAFYSRFFAPLCGILEDPVTGSAHCALTPYFYNKLIAVLKTSGKVPKTIENGRTIELVAKQRSERGGHLVVSIDETFSRVFIRGSAITTIKGKLLC